MKITEAPVVSLGKPKLFGRYQGLNLGGVVVFVPSVLAGKDLTIGIGHFFRRKYLVIEGWKVI